MTTAPTLLVITDRAAAARGGRTVEQVIAAVMLAGPGDVLLRDKDLPADERRVLGERLRDVVRAAGGRLFVASDVALARHLDADGVHLAAADPTVAVAAGDRARDAAGELLVGRSCHGPAEVVAAAAEGADYVTVSPVATSESKPGYGPALGVGGLRAAAAVGRGLAVLALGGVTPQNATRWRDAGADGLAVMGGVMSAPDPREVVRRLRHAWREADDAGSPGDTLSETRRAST